MQISILQARRNFIWRAHYFYPISQLHYGCIFQRFLNMLFADDFVYVIKNIEAKIISILICNTLPFFEPKQ